MTHNTILQGVLLEGIFPGDYESQLVIQCSCGETLAETAELMDLSDVIAISEGHRARYHPDTGMPSWELELLCKENHGKA